MTNKQLLIRPLLAILMALFALNTWATDPREDLYLTAERLFHISRSVNRNLVCYDAHLTNNGQLITDEPINVYWVNREERPGEKNGLNYFQRKMAYGYKVVDEGDDYSVVTLSAFRNTRFGEEYGVLITDSPMAGLFARAVVVLDENRRVIHAQLVPEITNEPDYDAALAALAALK